MPREKLPFTTAHKVLEFASAALLAAFLLYTAICYPRLPDTLPAHFGASGEIDRWADKSELLILPIMGAILFCGMTPIELFPEIWNIPVGQHDANLAQVQTATRTLLIVTKITVLALFFYITVFTAMQSNLPQAFLPITFLAIALPIVLYLIYVRRLKRNKA